MRVRLVLAVPRHAPANRIAHAGADLLRVSVER